MQIKVVLPNMNTPSMNKIYGARSFWTRKVMADEIHQLTKHYIKNPVMFEKPVSITVIAYFSGRQLDCSNIPLKIFEDALKGTLIKDDSPRYVKEVSAISRKDKLNPRVEIILDDSEDL